MFSLAEMEAMYFALETAPYTKFRDDARVKLRRLIIQRINEIDERKKHDRQVRIEKN